MDTGVCCPLFAYDARGNGDGETVPTLTGDHQNRITDYTTIVVKKMESYQKVTGALCAARYSKLGVQEAANGMYVACSYDGTQISPTLTRNNAGGSQRMPDKENFNAVIEQAKPPRKYVLRRLTPTECARLQGFPDWWTDGTDGADSAMYKMWGNGIALPCAADVIGRIAKAMTDQYGTEIKE